MKTIWMLTNGTIHLFPSWVIAAEAWHKYRMESRFRKLINQQRVLKR